jgi:hypothetical protein
MFGWSCFGAFVVCALVTGATGLLLIWRDDDQRYLGSLWLAFSSAFLLTVLAGLLVSGTRSMLGIIDGDQKGPSLNA